MNLKWSPVTHLWVRLTHGSRVCAEVYTLSGEWLAVGCGAFHFELRFPTKEAAMRYAEATVRLQLAHNQGE